MDILTVPTRCFPLLYIIKPIPNQRCWVTNLRGVGADDEGRVETTMAEPEEAGEDALPAAAQGMEEDAPVLACSAREWRDWRWHRRGSAGGLQIAGARRRIPSPAAARDCREDAAAAAPCAGLGGCAGAGDAREREWRGVPEDSLGPGGAVLQGGCACGGGDADASEEWREK
jgi:hypothetical protein